MVVMSCHAMIAYLAVFGAQWLLNMTYSAIFILHKENYIIVLIFIVNVLNLDFICRPYPLIELNSTVINFNHFLNDVFIFHLIIILFMVIVYLQV